MRSFFTSTLLLCFTASCTPGASTSNCLPLKSWSTQQQIEAATDLGRLPPDSVIFDMFDDYWDLHSRTEACHGIKKPAHKSQANPFLPDE